MLKARTKIRPKLNGKGRSESFEVTLPEMLAHDSQFTFKIGDEIEIEYLPTEDKIVITHVDKNQGIST